MLKMDVITAFFKMLQQMSCSGNVENSWGGGGHQRPTWNENS